MKYLPTILIYAGSYHLISSVTLYTLVRIFTYHELQAQYAEGGISAIFSITASNYHFGLVITFLFAAAAIFKGLELKNIEGKVGRSRLVTNGVLAAVVVLSAVYFTFLNLLLLFNPGYF